MRTFRNPRFNKIFFALVGIGLTAASFAFKHYRLHFIEKESDCMTVVNKEFDDSERYTGFTFFGGITISKDKPRYYLYLTRTHQKFSVRYGKEQLDAETLLKRKTKVSKGEFEKYSIGDVLNYSENQQLWDSGSFWDSGDRTED